MKLIIPIFAEYPLENKTLLKITFFSLMLSSCGYLDKWKTPETATDSSISRSNSSADDALDELDSLEMDSLAEATPSENPIMNDVAIHSEPSEEIIIAKEQELNTIPQINEQINQFQEEGSIVEYQVKKGETLMQIAFKIYGDISMWKDIKKHNPNVNTNSLHAGMKLKYAAPLTPFAWNPVGTPYLIKNGDTLGTISNEFYHTPAKWKTLWENNKPMIKNPNRIYSGFTIYAKTGDMASAVHPNQGLSAAELSEEIAVEKVLKQKPAIQPTQAPVVRALKQEVQAIDEDKLVDETIQSLSATKRKSLDKAINEDLDFTDDLDQFENSNAPSYTNESIDANSDVQVLD